MDVLIVLDDISELAAKMSALCAPGHTVTEDDLRRMASLESEVHASVLAIQRYIRGGE